jgi:hypothetical protein
MRGMHWRIIRHRFNFHSCGLRISVQRKTPARTKYLCGLPFWIQGKQVKPASLFTRASSKARTRAAILLLLFSTLSPEPSRGFVF